MKSEKADLIIHPIRLRIMQALSSKALTTQEIAALLPDVPKSSIYRHLKKLLDGEMVEVTEVNIIKGIEEKTYRITAPPHLGEADIADFSKEDHLRYFSGYIATVIQGFQNYLYAQEALDLMADRVGYREIKFYASTEEFDEVFGRFNQDLLKLIQNEPTDGRKLRKFVTISHPEIEE